MARIRTIKPEFWQSETIARMPFETRLLAIALLNYADDYGFFKSHPSLVKASCFPLDDSLKIFEEGIRLSKTCLKMLEDAERKVEILVQEKDGKKRIQAFSPGEDEPETSP